MNYFRSCLLISSVLFFNPSFGRVAEPLPSVEKMSVNEKVGQLFILGFSGTDLKGKTKAHFEDLRPGGTILFRKNIVSQRQLRSLTSSLRKSQKTPMLIAVDQEGGSVVRVPMSPRLPSAKWVGLRNRPDLTDQLGFEVGKVLLSYGINMNLAPVLDVTQSDSGFLHNRTYSSDPEIVSSLGRSYSEGLLRAGVLPTAKHFPGLGSIADDPHKGSVKVGASYKELFTNDLLPFKNFVAVKPSAIMLSHAQYPALDSTKSSATFSKQISTSLLKEELGFEGLVITDDLLMAGAVGSQSFSERVVEALKSGSDILLFAWSPKSQKAAQVAIIDALAKGILSKDWLNQKVAKILSIKHALAEKQRARDIASSPSKTYKSVILELQSVRTRRR